MDDGNPAEQIVSQVRERLSVALIERRSPARGLAEDLLASGESR